MGIATAIVGAVLVASTVKQRREEKKAASEVQRQNQIAQRRETIRSQRERVMALRQSRVAQASALAAGVNSGIVSESSGAMASGFSGATASYTSQMNANQAFAGQMDQLAQQNIDSLNRQVGFESRARGYGAVAGLASQAFPYARGFDTSRK